MLAVPLARIFGIPLADLVHKDLTGYTLDDLRRVYGFDVQEVMARAAGGLKGE